MIKLLILLFFPLSIYGQTLPSNDIGEWKTLTASNYSIQYPPTWELNESGYMGTSFIILSPLELDQDSFMENINLIIQDLDDKSIDLNKYVEISEDQIKIVITNSKMIESKRIKSESDEFHKVIYSGDQGELQLNYEQYYWVLNNKAFVLTFTTEQSKYDSFKEVGERILNSFRVNK